MITKSSGSSFAQERPCSSRTIKNKPIHTASAMTRALICDRPVHACCAGRAAGRFEGDGGGLDCFFIVQFEPAVASFLFLELTLTYCSCNVSIFSGSCLASATRSFALNRARIMSRMKVAMLFWPLRYEALFIPAKPSLYCTWLGVMPTARAMASVCQPASPRRPHS